MFKKIFKIPCFFLIILIKIYQKTLSFDHGILRWLYPYGYCRFYPSCSEYGRQAIEKYGCFRGLWLAGKRLSKCHPWSRGGEDCVP
ncbi:MAG: hypothetical protein UU48_C0008G0013 [Candidatus Uhrbacteria bacterium GW2011_GWF2_41_16]|uniref:Putative membrane protein insertion efficiency factor n=2 Tax=Candidatus Uhriibacteriota TaxID=1752732 RepID=A0A0G0VA45_9BACT|nr:MAG: hypothetical protein UU35_C0014G0024 [Candidatus Uhrbacteria bacterium GW2011_GWC2_41_11]KKR97804.1 MAG: hypothetical protein UU48_C0008G0013 [Candidatus Uhrbacteria bacterium GW2011_GWF2_41_16]HBP00265.1 membrane protein insertion efficiency factor YidD [Candidatus Uhrbacteria bacterium]